MSFLPFSIQHALAGLWPLVWHWGIPVGVILLCIVGELALAWFGAAIPFIGEKMVRPLQTLLCAVAIGAGLFLWGLGDGIKAEKGRSDAQQAVILKQVGTVVDDVLNDPDNQPKVEPPVKKGEKSYPRKPPSDRWDSPEN